MNWKITAKGKSDKMYDAETFRHVKSSKYRTLWQMARVESFPEIPHLIVTEN